MFAVGVDRSTSSSPLFVRCPRHLRCACEICVTPGRTAPPRTSSDRRANERAPVADGWGISGFSEGAGVGSGLAWPGSGASLLRRAIPPPDEARGPRAPKNTRLAELIPRFLRLSALVALELGREVGTTASAEDTGAKALVPTAEWYLLLAGLLTCAVLEGYLTAGWAGLTPVQVLLGVGLGSAVIPEASPLTTNDEYNEFEPDGMPNLPNAVNVLFPGRSSPSGNIASGASGSSNFIGSGGSGSGRRGHQGSDPRVLGGGGEEAEFSHEMEQRVARFLNVPAGTPDLSTHMEDLAWRYPAEPVERAALRFCEALARWRGKPELQTYKKRPSTLDPSRTPTMPEGGIAGGTNAAVRRAIGRYFVIPHTTTASTSATPVVAASASNAGGPAAGVSVGDGAGDGRTAVGRKRSHSSSGVAAAAAALSGSSAGNRWRERRGYV